LIIKKTYHLIPCYHYALQQLIMKKITVLSDLVNDLSLYIGICKADEPNPLVVLCVKEAYRKHNEQLKSVDVLNQEEEGLFVQLVSARINLSQVVTIMQTSGILTSGVECMSEKFSKEINGLCKKIRKIISTMENEALETGIDFLSKAFKANEYSHDNLKSAVDHVSTLSEMDDFETVKKDAEEVSNMTMLLEKSVWIMMQWLTVLCSRQCKESATKSLTLPPRLETWLDTTSGNNASQADNLKLTCSGVGGENRVSSIISGLIYRWLEARCAEWHAELTRDELLQSMEEPAKAVSPRKGGRKSKKKKAATNSIGAKASSLSRGDTDEKIMSSHVPETVQQKADSKGDASHSIDDDQQKNHTISPDEDEDEKIFSGEYDTTTSSNDEPITSTPKTTDQLVVPNSSSDDMAEEKKYEDVNLYENSDNQVGQPQPTENEVYIKDRIDNLDQNVFTPTEDSLCTDPSVVDSSSTSSHNYIHQQVDTQEDTLDYLTTIRSRLKEQFISDNVNEGITVDSISQNVRAVQTLLTSNEEIYNRFRGHIESVTDEKTTFIKANHTIVDAHHNEVTSMFQFVTYPEHCQLEFDTNPLSSVPFSLEFGDITIRLRHIGGVDSKETYYINYTALFESLVMLHDDETLGPHLAKLRGHLETVQACLTKIDDWISTPSSNTKYLQQTFGEERLQVSNKTIKHFCVEGSHQDHEICFQCEHSFDQHNVEQQKVHGSKGGFRRLCSHPEDRDLPYFMCSKCDADSDIQCAHYQVEESYVLREFQFDVSDSNTEFVCSGTFDKSFDISNERERNQMNKLLEFIEMISKG